MADLILKLHPSMSFSDMQTRERFVKFVARLLSTDSVDFAVYQLNKNTTNLEWSVDQSNNWWVFFDENDWSKVRIKQRYDVAHALRALGGWLAYRWQMTVETAELALPD